MTDLLRPCYRCGHLGFSHDNWMECAECVCNAWFGDTDPDPPMTVTVDLQDNPTLVGWVMNDE